MTSTVWLITGSSRGLGLEFVHQLSSDSKNIIIASCRTPSSATALSELTKSSAATIHLVQLDTDDEASIKKAYETISGLLGDKQGIDYLLSNAGSAGTEDWALTITKQNILDRMAANVCGPVLIAQTFLPLVERAPKGVIMNMSSGLGSIGIAYGPIAAAYSMSKAALNMFTFKLKLAKPEVVIISMDPGWVKTDMGGEGADLEKEESISGMLKVLRKLEIKDSGSFFRWNGDIAPW